MKSTDVERGSKAPQHWTLTKTVWISENMYIFVITKDVTKHLYEKIIWFHTNAYISERNHSNVKSRAVLTISIINYTIDYTKDLTSKLGNMCAIGTDVDTYSEITQTSLYTNGRTPERSHTFAQKRIAIRVLLVVLDLNLIYVLIIISGHMCAMSKVVDANSCTNGI